MFGRRRADCGRDSAASPFLGRFASTGALAGICLWFCVDSSRKFRTLLFLRMGPKAEILFQRMGLEIPASHVVYGTRVATMTSCARGSSFARFVVVDGSSSGTNNALFSLASRLVPAPQRSG